MKNGKYSVESVVVKLTNGETIEVDCANGFYRVSENYIRYANKSMNEWPKFMQHEVRWTNPL